jgi:hypothetical protein
LLAVAVAVARRLFLVALVVAVAVQELCVIQQPLFLPVVSQ